MLDKLKLETLPPNMMKRGDFYYVRMMIEGEDKWKSTRRTTLKAAVKEADRIKVKLRDGDFDDDPNIKIPTFQEWSTVYQRVYSVLKSDPDRDRNAIKAASDSFNRKRLDEVTKTFCQDYLNRRRKTVAAATLNTEQSILQAVFEKALEDDLITKNPWKGIDRQDTGPRIRVLSEESELRLRRALSSKDDRWLTFMLETGLRLEEARGISIDEVEFGAHLIHVPAESAKGGKARSVPTSEEVEEVITIQMNEAGKLWHNRQQYYRQLLTDTCEKTGIGHISPHDLRHTFATRFLKNGGDIFILSKILGHSSVKITEDTYVHLEFKDLVGPRRRVNVSATGSATLIGQPKSGKFNGSTLTLIEKIENI